VVDDPRDHRISELEAENAELRVQVARVDVLEAQVAELAALVLDLRARLKADSHTSSKPPSSDGLTKRPAVPRVRGTRKPGKQPGAEGHRLEPVDSPDEYREHAPEHCSKCSGSLAGADVVGVERRQVGDIPPIALRWIEHQAQSRRCACGHVTKAVFPAGVTAPVGYGPGVQAVAAYLHVFQHQPYGRVQMTLEDILGAKVSLGWIPTAITRISESVEGVCEFIADAIAGGELAHFDETGGRVEGSLHWIHVASTSMLTHLGLSKRRGSVGMLELGIVPRFKGVAVHDGLASYRQFQHTHALCNAHHLRELEGIVEHYEQAWAQDMADLLRDCKKHVERAIERGHTSLNPRVLARLLLRYQKIIKAGHAANPPPQPTRKRGRPKLGKAGNLVRRLDEYQTDALRFLTDFRSAVRQQPG
jgi:transposase